MTGAKIASAIIAPSPCLRAAMPVKASTIDSDRMASRESGLDRRGERIAGLDMGEFVSDQGIISSELVVPGQ